MFFNRTPSKSNAEKELDNFMVAIKEIQTLVVKNGRISMDASELETKVFESRRTAKNLVRQS